VSASADREVVMRLETDIDVTAPQPGSIEKAAFADPGSRFSANIRDNLAEGSLGIHAPAANRSRLPAGARCEGLAVPYGWWTGDGLGLVRRSPAGPGVSPSVIQTHYYPLNTLTRVSGRAVALDSSAWLTLYSAQPGGTTAQLLPGMKGLYVEVMLHRHLSRDDGRGLGTGVYDSTVLAPALRLSVLAVVGAASCAPAAAKLAPADESARAAPGPDAAAGGSPPLSAWHEDWVWGWATRAALLQAPLMVLYADLSGLQPPGTILPAAPFTAPPREPGSDVAHLSLLVRSEPAVPRGAWTSRYSTTYNAASGLPWQLPPAPRPDAYPDRVAESCAAGGLLSGHPTVCRAVSGSSSSSSSFSSASFESSRSLPPWVHMLTLQVRLGRARRGTGSPLIVSARARSTAFTPLPFRR
jgi:hypothetical protein